MLTLSLNVTGAQEISWSTYGVLKRRIYVGSFVYQVKVADGDRSIIEKLEPHDTFFLWSGENVGEPGCDISVELFKWLPKIRQPVVWIYGTTYGLENGGNTITTWVYKDNIGI